MKAAPFLGLVLGSWAIAQDRAIPSSEDSALLSGTPRVRVVRVFDSEKRDAILEELNPGESAGDVMKAAKGNISAWHAVGGGFGLEGHMCHSLFVDSLGNSYALGVLERDWKIVQIVKGLDEPQWTFSYKSEPGVLGWEVAIRFSKEGRFVSLSDRKVMIYFDPREQQLLGPRQRKHEEGSGKSD